MYVCMYVYIYIYIYRDPPGLARSIGKLKLSRDVIVVDRFSHQAIAFE